MLMLLFKPNEPERMVNVLGLCTPCGSGIVMVASHMLCSLLNTLATSAPLMRAKYKL